MAEPVSGGATPTSEQARQALLLRLSEALRPLPDSGQILHEAARLLGGHEEAVALRRAHDELERRVQERTAELLRQSQELRALAGEITLVEQRERSRLAKVLHDHLQQSI